MSQFKQVAQALRRHFHSVNIERPAGESALRELCKRVPSMPDELLAFWRYCDGIRVTRFEDGELYGIERSLSLYPVGEAQELKRFIPLRGDGCGDYDCLIVGQGLCEGAVVFWDHEVYDGASYLLGGSLLNYLGMWVEQMIHQHLPNGERDPRRLPREIDSAPWIVASEYQHPWPFDEAWMRSRDPIAEKLLSDETSRRWLLEQDSSEREP